MTHKSIYLDYAAATPLDKRVLEAMKPYFTELFYNPSAEYLAAKDVKNAIDEARSKVAFWLGAKPPEIIFTSGGTEANNLAINGVMDLYPGANVVVSAVEHESVLAPARQYDYKTVDVSPDGRVKADNLENTVDDSTVLISVMQANNEVGTLQPIRSISKVAASIRSSRKASGNTMPLYLHVDACQAANYLDLHVEKLGVDMMTLNGGKIYGPKQSGALYVSSKVQISPQIVGGGQERNRRSGTENVASIIGFAEALDIAQKMKDDESKRLQDLQSKFYESVQKAIPGVVINGSQKYRLPNNLHISLPGQDNERLIFALDDSGVQVAAGSACSASNEEASHVLRAMGVSEQDARASLRLSMGRDTSLESVASTIEALVEITAN